MQFEEAKTIAQKMGFQLFSVVTGETNINKFFPEASVRKYKENPYCGVYMQFRLDGNLYVGQTRDLRRRYAKHREHKSGTKYLAFLHCPPEKLDEEEIRCIEAARLLRLPLINMTCNRTAPGRGKGCYDNVIAPEEQDAFIERAAECKSWTGSWATLFKNTAPVFRAEWERFCFISKGSDLLAAASAYVHTAIPCPEDTESDFWKSLLMPQQRRGGARRPAVAIHTGLTVGLELFCWNKIPRQYYAAVSLAPSVIREAFRTPEDFSAALPGAVLDMPPPDEPADDEDETAAMMNVQPLNGKAVPFISPSQLASDIVRPVSQVNAKAPAVVTVPIDAFETVLQHPVIAAAAAMNAIAAMRLHPPLVNDHNPLLARRILTKRFF